MVIIPPRSLCANSNQNTKTKINTSKVQPQPSFLEEHNPTAGEPTTGQPIRTAAPRRPAPGGIRNAPVAVRVAGKRAGEEVPDSGIF